MNAMSYYDVMKMYMIWSKKKNMVSLFDVPNSEPNGKDQKVRYPVTTPKGDFM